MEPIFENRTLITLAVSFFYGITKLNKPSSTRRSLKFYEKFYADTIKAVGVFLCINVCMKSEEGIKTVYSQ